MASRIRLAFFSVLISVSGILDVHQNGASTAAENGQSPQSGVEVHPAMMISAELRDGSMVTGRLADRRSLSLQTSFSREQIPFQLGYRVQLNDDMKTVVVEFRNGDRLTGSLADKSLKVQSVSGELDVALDEITSVYVSVPLSLPAKLRESLALHYGFDVGGKQAFDQSGSGIHGMIKGAKRTRDGKHGHALQFKAGDHVEIGNPMHLKLRALTVAAWIRFEPSETKNRFRIFKGELGDRVVDDAKLVDGDLDDRRLDYGFQVYNTSASPWTYVGLDNRSGHSTFQPLVDTWLHVASTYDGDGQAAHYVNGELIKHTQTKGKMGEIPDRYSWKIGAWVGQFAGRADEVMMFNRALSHDEMKQLYDAVK